MAKTMKDLVNELGKAKAAEQAWLRKSEAEAMKNRGGTLYNAWARQGPVDIAAYRRTMGGNPHADKIAKLASQIRQMRSGGGQSASSPGSGGQSLGGLSGLSGLEGLLSAYQSMQQAQQPSLADQLSYEYARRMEEANAANEARYNQGLDELTSLRDRSMADLANVGQQQAADIDRNFGMASGQVQQDLSRRGLLGTSRVGSEARRLEEGRAASQNRLAEQLAMARIGADQSLTNNLTGWIERRNDTGPDLNQLIGLQQGLGASGMQGLAAGLGVGGMSGGGGYPGQTNLTAGGGGLTNYGPQNTQVTAGTSPSVGNKGPGSFPAATHPGMPAMSPGTQVGVGGGPGVGHAGPGSYPGSVGPGQQYRVPPGIDPSRILDARRDPVMSGIQTLLTQELSRLTSGGRVNQQQQQRPTINGPTLSVRPTGPRPVGSMGTPIMGAPIFAGSGMFSVPGMAMGQMPQMQQGIYSNWTPTPYGQRPQTAAPQVQRKPQQTGGYGYGVSTPTLPSLSMWA